MSFLRRSFRCAMFGGLLLAVLSQSGAGAYEEERTAGKGGTAVDYSKMATDQIGLPAAEPDTLRFDPIWLNILRREALDSGISQQTIDLALGEHLRKIPRIVKQDRKQAEKVQTYEDYRSRRITDGVVAKGRKMLMEHGALLDQISAAYGGVPPEIIVATWGVETSYGRNTGGEDVISALATLAEDDRRGPYFRKELIHALRILDQGHIDLEHFRGSWAGAMGDAQFMPSSFFDYAQDWNKDGRKNIWASNGDPASLGDVFASVANYYRANGWQSGKRWGRAVNLPEGFPRNLVTTAKDNKVVRPLSDWRKHNVLRADDGMPVDADPSIDAYILQPDGPGGRAFAVYDNFGVIMRYNPAYKYALVVGELSREISSP